MLESNCLTVGALGMNLNTAAFAGVLAGFFVMIFTAVDILFIFWTIGIQMGFIQKSFLYDPEPIAGIMSIILLFISIYVYRLK